MRNSSHEDLFGLRNAPRSRHTEQRSYGNLGSHKSIPFGVCRAELLGIFVIKFPSSDNIHLTTAGRNCRSYATVNLPIRNVWGELALTAPFTSRGGPQILEECGEIRRTRFPQGLPTGEAVITSAGLLTARQVFDVVRPIKGVFGVRDAEQLTAEEINLIFGPVKYYLMEDETQDILLRFSNKGVGVGRRILPLSVTAAPAAATLPPSSGGR